MKTRLSTFVALCALNMAACAAKPVDVTAIQNNDFVPVSGLKQKPDSPAVIGARVADPALYPASFYSSSGGGRCTSSLVAGNVLLTAAHCVADGGEIAIVIKGKRITGKCTHAPGYVSDDTSDWALCLMASAAPVKPFETVNTDAGRVIKGKDLRLTGFGCTEKNTTGGNDGIYREGEAVIVQVPSAQSNDIVTRASSKKTAVLCPGDSGGPAFIAVTADYKLRYLASVNSRTEMQGGLVLDTSYLSSVSSTDALDFMKSWSKANGATICGLSPNAKNCR